MDNFKEFLQQHKHDAYEDVPSSKVWQHVQQQITTNTTAKVVKLRFIYAAAACCIALLGIGIFFFYNKNENGQIAQQTTITKPITSPDIINAETATSNANTTTTDANTLNNNPTIAANTNTEKNNKSNTTTPKYNATAANNKILHEQLQAFSSIESGFKQVINLQKQRINTTPLQAENPNFYTDFTSQFKQLERDEKGVKENIINKGITNENLEQLISIYQYKINVLKQLQNEINKTNSRYKVNRAPVDTVKTYFLNL